MVGALEHPGIVGVHDYGEDNTDGEVVYLVMQLVKGCSLAAVLRRRERLEPEETLTLLAMCADALAAAHRDDVVHRE